MLSVLMQDLKNKMSRALGKKKDSILFLNSIVVGFSDFLAETRGKKESKSK